VADKQFLNLYSISFKIQGQEYGSLLEQLIIKKDVTNNKFVEDKFIFKYDAMDLLSASFASVDIEIAINQSSAYKTIYKNSGFISKTQKVNSKIVIFVEMRQKTNWLRKNGVSLTIEHATARDALKKYIEKIDSFYKHKHKTLFNINNDKNLNKFKYENLLFPIKKNHFDVIEKFAKQYFILNAPYFLFFDDYNFTDKQHPVSVNIYDMSNIKSLRATLASDLNSHSAPLLKKTLPYYDGNTLYKVNLVQKIPDLKYTYSKLKPKDKLEPANRFLHNTTLDTEDNVAVRQKLAKEFYSKSSVYHRYSIHDIDVTKLIIGNRYVDDTSDAKIQYTQGIIDATFRFAVTGHQDAIKNKGDFVNQATVIADFTALSY